MLRCLAERGRVSLACTAQRSVAPENRRRLALECDRLAIGGTTRLGRIGRSAYGLAAGKTATEGFFWSRSLANTVSRWAREEAFDAVVCYCSSMYQYARLAVFPGTRLIVDLVDVDSRKWAQCSNAARPPAAWVYSAESKRVLQLEKSITKQADEVFVVSKDERDLLAQVTNRSDVRAATNGVDTDYFAPNHSVTSDANTCCFVGVLNYQPNEDGLRWFVNHVWPLVRAHSSQARFLIVGRKPTASIHRLSAEPGVELHADVPDVRPYLNRAAVSVAPLQIARGLQNKVLEAMAMKKPVLATDAAVEGIHAAPGECFITAREPDAWASRLLRLFSDEERRYSLGQFARQYVVSHHSWRECLAPLLDSLSAAPSRDFDSRVAVA